MFDFAVLGLGKSGLAALRFLSRRYPKSKILASDGSAEAALASSAARVCPQAKIELGGHSEDVLKARCVIKSPGLDPKAAIFSKLRQAGIRVISELDLAFEHLGVRPKMVVTISGTNGKTTTTDLTGHLFRSCGWPVVVAGNIGVPLADAVDQVTDEHAVILEVSSYQLEDSVSLAPDVAILMNVTPDHLAHHGTWENYVSAKTKLFKFVRPDGLSISNYEDEHARVAAASSKAKVAFFSSTRELKEGSWIAQGRLCAVLEKSRLMRQYVLEPSKNLIGTHNLENQMAALLAALRADLPQQKLQYALESYQPPAHRLQRVGEIGGVLFINDSKATNVDSVIVALRALNDLARQRLGKIHLLLGGQDKGAPYGPIVSAASEVAAIYCFGDAKKIIADQLSPSLNCVLVESLELATRSALKRSRRGDLVVLSPACASFDQFRNYEHRGEEFQRFFVLLRDRKAIT